MSDQDPDELVTLHVAANEFEARTIVAILEDREVKAVAFPTSLQTLGLDCAGVGMMSGIPVQVRFSDLERGRAALRANQFLADSVDWDAVDVGEEDPEAEQLARKGPLFSYGRFMVTCGKWAVAVLVAVQIVVLVARCS